MPWCAQCDRFLSPSTVHADGACPRCGRPVDPGRARPPADLVAHAGPVDRTGPVADPRAPGPVVGEPDDLGPVPWHFKVFLAAATLYLGWRVVQLVGWFT